MSTSHHEVSVVESTEINRVLIDAASSVKVIKKWQELVAECPADDVASKNGLTLNVFRRRTMLDSNGEVEEEEIEKLVLDPRESKLFLKAMKIFGCAALVES